MKNIFAFASLLLLVGCNESTSENLENLDKKSAREVTLTTVTKNDTVYHLTKQIIWINGEQIANKVDTIKTPLKVQTWSADTTNMRLNQVPIYVTVQ